MNKNWKRFSRSVCLFAALILTCMEVITVRADMSYETYSYDWWGNDVLQPHAYLYTKSLTTDEFGSSLNNPKDLYVWEDLLFIADTDNSRIISCTPTGEVLLEIKEFKSDEGEDSLSQPQGVFVTEEGRIYVADSGNGRIVEFDGEGHFIRQIGEPVTELIAENQTYMPIKVVVDSVGRIYVIAYGINMGLVEFNSNGEFQGFMGATEVSVSSFEYIWKNYFSTEAQKLRMETIIPTEYSNIYVDDKNFVYATISGLSLEDYINGADAVRRLNPTGTDVLRRLGNYSIIGDLYRTSTDEKFSSFTDIYATDFGCYFILDSAGGKVFCYDYDGNSLFIFGNKGTRTGMMQRPVALDVSSDQSSIYVLDGHLGHILVYEITEYGSNLMNAMKSHHGGDSEKAYEYWQEVLKRNANSEIAYIGLGKTFLKQGEYKQAMQYFELGNSRKYYTKAFQFHRKELMQNNFGKFMAIIGVFILIIVGRKIVRKIRRWVGEAKCNIGIQ